MKQTSPFHSLVYIDKAKNVGKTKDVPLLLFYGKKHSMMWQFTLQTIVCPQVLILCFFLSRFREPAFLWVVVIKQKCFSWYDFQCILLTFLGRSHAFEKATSIDIPFSLVWHVDVGPFAFFCVIYVWRHVPIREIYKSN